jgi:sulfate transport system ATP-binding protein
VGTANVLRGHVEGDRATLGSLSVAIPSGVPDGTQVQAIVRPHNVRLAKNGVDGTEASSTGMAARSANPPASSTSERSVGTITRLVGLGAHVKLQLELPSSDSVTVQLPRKEAESMNLAVGDKVIFDLGEAKVFIEDYSI